MRPQNRFHFTTSTNPAVADISVTSLNRYYIQLYLSLLGVSCSELHNYSLNSQVTDLGWTLNIRQQRVLARSIIVRQVSNTLSMVVDWLVNTSNLFIFLTVYIALLKYFDSYIYIQTTVLCQLVTGSQLVCQDTSKNNRCKANKEVAGITGSSITQTKNNDKKHI